MLIETAKERLRCQVEASIDAKRRLLDHCEHDILAAAAAMVDCFASGGKVLLCGNGGSAADCQHIAAEFVSVLSRDVPRPGLPAIALTTDTSLLTANANDFGFEGVFARQVQALGSAGDVLIGISTSGNSANILRALECAKARRMRTVGLTGASEGSMAHLCEVLIRVPSDSTQRIQEAHILIGHALVDLAEQSLLASGHIRLLE